MRFSPSFLLSPSSTMPDRFSARRRERITLAISRTKKRISSFFSRSTYVNATPSHLHSASSENNAGRLDTSAHHAENQLPCVQASHDPSVSNASVHPATDFIPGYPFPGSSESPPHQLEDMANRNHFSTNPTCPSAPSLPDEQVSSIPGSNVGTPFKFGTFLHNTYGKFHSPKITVC